MIYRPAKRPGRGTELTLVTPEAPAGHPFSGWAYALLAGCVGARR